MKNKGQALVEFVLLLPVIFLILFAVIDIAKIYYDKNHLEGVLDDIVTMVENNASKNDIIKSINDKDVTYNITKDNNYITIKLEKKINFITPFAENVFKNSYKITTQRVILYE